MVISPSAGLHRSLKPAGAINFCFVRRVGRTACGGEEAQVVADAKWPHLVKFWF